MRIGAIWIAVWSVIIILWAVMILLASRSDNTNFDEKGYYLIDYESGDLLTYSQCPTQYGAVVGVNIQQSKYKGVDVEFYRVVSIGGHLFSEVKVGPFDPPEKCGPAYQ